MHSLATILFSYTALANIVLDCKSAEVDTCVKVCQEKCGEVFADVKLAAQCLKTHEIKCLFSFYELETSEIACLTKSEDESKVYVQIPKASIGTSDNQVLNTFTYGMFNSNDLNRSRDEPVLRIQGTASLTKTPDCNKNVLPDPADSKFIDIEPNPNNPRQYPIQKIFSKLVSSDRGPRWVRLRLRFAPKNASDEITNTEVVEPARKRRLETQPFLEIPEEDDFQKDYEEGEEEDAGVEDEYRVDPEEDGEEYSDENYGDDLEYNPAPTSTTIPDPTPTTITTSVSETATTTVAFSELVPSFEDVWVPFKVDGSLLSADGVIKTDKPEKRFRWILWIVVVLSVITIIGVSVLLWRYITAANALRNHC